MLTFVYDHDEEIADVFDRLTPGSGRDIGKCKTIGVIDEEGKLLAGFVYHHYNRKSFVMEMGTFVLNRRAVNRTILRRVLEYPFLECSCQLLIAHTHADNELVLSQLARLNFEFTLIPRWYGRAEDGVLCTLTDDQWLDNKFSRQMYRKEELAA